MGLAIASSWFLLTVIFALVVNGLMVSNGFIGVYAFPYEIAVSRQCRQC
jgi:hypothetical protein